MKKNRVNVKSSSLRIIEGIAKAKLKIGKWGYPSVTATKGAPNTPLRIIEIRIQYLSPSMIASIGDIVMVSTIRLLNLCKKEGDFPENNFILEQQNGEYHR